MKNDNQNEKHRALQRALARIEEPNKAKPPSARAVHIRKQEFRKSAKQKVLEPTNPNYRSSLFGTRE